MDPGALEAACAASFAFSLPLSCRQLLCGIVILELQARNRGDRGLTDSFDRRSLKNRAGQLPGGRLPAAA